MGLSSTSDELLRSGFARLNGKDLEPHIVDTSGESEWASFSDSWSNLCLDTHMADNGEYRERRYAAFSLMFGKFIRKPHQAHFQTRHHNALNGGINRWFQPVKDDITSHPCLLALGDVCSKIFSVDAPTKFQEQHWHSEMHQIRIKADADSCGYPTPEGLHRDGVTWVAVILIARENINAGETLIYDTESAKSQTFTLTDPLDAIFLDDSRVRHAVLPITRKCQNTKAYRDVLVLTFAKNSLEIATHRD